MSLIVIVGVDCVKLETSERESLLVRLVIWLQGLVHNWIFHQVPRHR